MKNKILLKRLLIFLQLFLIMNNSLCFSQELDFEPVTQNEKEFLVARIADSLEYYYVDINVGIEIGNVLKANIKKGVYQNIFEPSKFATAITRDLRSVNGDLHLFLGYKNPTHNSKNSSLKKTNSSRGISTNYGFQELKFIEEKIVYLKITHFSNWDYASDARKRIAEIMSIFKNSSAFIIDLRDNRGGVPYIASFLASYFFNDQPIHLADFYIRYNNYKYGIYTEPNAPGMKYPKTPLYILVNEKSASAAEEFAFWLQNQKRATIIGQTTAGAGYGVMNHKLNERFTISISSEKEIDPITEKGFQGIGVIPDIILNDTIAYATALNLAKEVTGNPKMSIEDKLINLDKLLDTKEIHFINQTEIFEEVMLLSQLGLLSYDDINNLGNKYQDTPEKAVPILKAFSTLYSFYPHPFLEYAKALENAKSYQEALLNYDKAVLLAKTKKNPSLQEFIMARDTFLKKSAKELKN